MLTPGQGPKINVMKTQGNLGIDMCLDVVLSLSLSLFGVVACIPTLPTVTKHCLP